MENHCGNTSNGCQGIETIKQTIEDKPQAIEAPQKPASPRNLRHRAISSGKAANTHQVASRW